MLQMKFFYSIYALLYLFSFSRKTITENISSQQQLSRCQRHEINVTKLNISFGVVDPLYNFAQAMCRQMQTRMDYNHVKRLVNIIVASDGHFLISDVGYLLLTQPWALVFTILGILYIILLPLSSIIFFCGTNVCAINDSSTSSEALEISEQNQKAKCLFALNLTILAITIVIILIAVIVYWRSVNYVIAESGGIDKSINDIQKDLFLVLTTASNDLTCKINKTLKELNGAINHTIHQLPNKIYQIFNEHYAASSIANPLDTKNISITFDTANLAIRTAIFFAHQMQPNSYQELLIHKLNKTLKRIENCSLIFHQFRDGTLAKQMKSMRNEEENLFDAIKNKMTITLNHLNRLTYITSNKTDLWMSHISEEFRVVSTVIKIQLGKMTNIHRKITNHPRVRAASVALFPFIVFPVSLVSVPSILVIIFGTYLLVSRDRFRPQQQRCWRCGGFLALCAAAAAFFTGWFIMLFANIIFVGGFGVEVICRPLFYDDIIQSYEMPYFNIKITNPIDMTFRNIGFGELLYQCKYYKTLLSALKTEHDMKSYDELHAQYLSKIERQNVLQLYQYDFSFVLTNAQIEQLNNTHVELIKLKNELSEYNISQNFTEIASKLNISLMETKRYVLMALSITTEMEKSVEMIVNGSLEMKFLIEIAQKIINDELNIAFNTLSKHIINAKFYLLNRTFVCRPFYDCWNNAGIVFCNQFVRPIHGIWLSTGIIALCFILVIITAILASKVFFSVNKNSKKKFDRSYSRTAWIATNQHSSTNLANESTTASSNEQVKDSQD